MRSARAFACTVWLLASAGVAAAQTPELVSDRPDFTESAVAMGRGTAQLETGYSYGREGGDATHSIGEMLLRAGLGRGIELRLGLNSYSLAEIDGATTSGLEDAAIGTKVHVTAGRGLLPATALIAMIEVPTGTSAMTADAVQGELVGAFAWDLPAELSLGMNAGFLAGALDDTDDDTWSGSVTVGRSLGDRVGAFVEAYGFAGNGRQAFVDGGLTIALGTDLQLDARIGSQVSGGSAREFGIGLVRRWR